MTIRLLTVTRVLHAPIAEAWAMTSSFGAVDAWMPGVSHVALTGIGIGAVRSVLTPHGTAVEKLTMLDADHHRIRYTVRAPGMEILENCAGGIDLTAVSPDRTRLDWGVEAEIDVDLHIIAPILVQFFEAGIAGLAKFLGTDFG
jgi:carbon monoxide dehydrogenase subunit G